MKPGVRALGIAESYRGDESTFAGVVVRANRVIDGFAFSTCTVGGLDADETLLSLVERLDREDIRYVFIGAVAPAWYNILDVKSIADTIEIPIICVTFEGSEGLEAGIRNAFNGDARRRRIERYQRLPSRVECTLNGEARFIRAVGLDVEDAIDIAQRFTPEGGRPEPLRVARMAARAADDRFRGE